MLHSIELTSNATLYCIVLYCIVQYCEVDGLAAEHFIYADAIIHIHLPLLFDCFISHGYLPRDFMKTAIVPIIKNKAGNFSDKANYRPITLVTACSKISEFCLLIKLEKYLHTIYCKSVIK